MNKKVFFAVLLSVAIGCVSAQKISGNISPLKNQKEVNLVLDFSGALVNGEAESKYIADETKGKSKAEKEEWMSEWKEKLREDTYAMLENDLNKAVSSKWFSVGDYKDAEYTIIVKVKEITTGFFAGPFTKPSAVQADVRIVKTDGKTPIATIEFKKCSSKISGTIPYFVTRIAMSFGKLGDDIGKVFNKNLK